MLYHVRKLVTCAQRTKKIIIRLLATLWQRGLGENPGVDERNAVMHTEWALVPFDFQSIDWGMAPNDQIVCVIRDGSVYALVSGGKFHGLY